ncbi:MAG: hypothetical protein WBV67_03175 [Candidatus Cybelea sp.]
MRQTFRLSSCNVNCSAKRDADKPVKLSCYGIDPEPYECTVKHPESPGEFCFPPLASLITGGSHLLLALLERLVTDRGGTYAMEDTDSIAIVASKEGGLVACPFLRALLLIDFLFTHFRSTPGSSEETTFFSAFFVFAIAVAWGAVADPA